MGSYVGLASESPSNISITTTERIILSWSLRPPPLKSWIEVRTLQQDNNIAMQWRTGALSSTYHHGGERCLSERADPHHPLYRLAGPHQPRRRGVTLGHQGELQTSSRELFTLCRDRERQANYNQNKYFIKAVLLRETVPLTHYLLIPDII